MTLPADKLEIVARFLTAPEAHLARGRLEQEGIQAFIDGEHHITMNWMISNAVGGVKLLVRSQDLGVAKEILDTEPPAISDQETGDQTEYNATEESERTCPNCNSSNIVAERFSRKVAVISLLLFGFPLLFMRRKYVCNDCHHRWKETMHDFYRSE